jgi:hypothetical protein
MAQYTITLNPEQEAALDWCLGEQQRENPDEAPKDKAGLVLALVRDRVGSVVRQYQEATAHVDVRVSADLAAKLGDAEQVKKARKALGLS